MDHIHQNYVSDTHCLHGIPLDLVSIPQAAFMAGLHPNSLYRMIRRGNLRAFGRRGFLRISLRELLAPRTPGRGES
jgi:hypothetical protein